MTGSRIDALCGPLLYGLTALWVEPMAPVEAMGACRLAAHGGRIAYASGAASGVAHVLLWSMTQSDIQRGAELLLQGLFEECNDHVDQ